MIALAGWCLERPRLTLAVTLGLTALLGVGALRLELRTDGAFLLPAGNPVIERDRVERARFRDPDELLLVVEAEAGGPSLASSEGLRALRDLDARLRRLPVLRPTGLVSLPSWPRFTRSAAGVRVETFAEALPDDPTAAAALLAETREQPLVRGLLLSDDGRRALFALPIRRGVAPAAAARALEDFCAGERDDGYALLLGGPVLAETLLGDKVLDDLAVLIPLMLALIAALLYAMQRGSGAVAIALIETLLVLVWTFGAMGWAGVPVALVTTILPVVLMAMSIADEIHLLQSVASHWGLASMRERVLGALGDVGRPIVLTSLTTAVGFLSFTTASIEPLRSFGVFAAFGIVVAMLFSFTAIPALLVLLPERQLRPARALRAPSPRPGHAELAARHPVASFVLGLLALAVALPGVSQLRVSDSWVENFDPDSSLVRSERAINESFWGSYRFDIVLEGGPQLFRSPRGVALLAALEDTLRQAPHVGGVHSPLVPLEPLAAALDGDRPLEALSRGELFDLFTVAEMAPDSSSLARSLSDAGDTARLRLFVASADYAKARELEHHLERVLPALLEPYDVEFHFSGDLPVASVLVASIVRDQLRSIAFVLAAVALLLVASSRRLASLWALAPVLAAMAGLFGWMGYARVSLGIATSMFASLAVGVGVDFGIHFLHRWQRERAAGLTREEAITATVRGVGPALFWNAAVLAGGFCVLLVSELRPNRDLGRLLAGSMLACYAGCVLLLPFVLSRTGRAALGAAAALATLLAAPPLRAGELPCDGSDDPAARVLLERLELSRRSVPRILRMHATTTFLERGDGRQALPSPSPKTIWGALAGDGETTRLLYVFSGPGRMAGTSLLLLDYTDAARADDTWLYLDAFSTFSKLVGAVERSMVPGTALSYEDARGYVNASHYRFQFLDASGSAGRSVLACPVSPEIADRLGYGALRIRLDPSGRLIERIDYESPGGAPLKTYRLQSSVEVDGVLYPARVHLLDRPDGFENEIDYAYWLPKDGIPAALFRPEVDDESFLDRMRGLLAANGLGERIETELAEARRTVEAHDARQRERKRSAAGGS